MQRRLFVISDLHLGGQPDSTDATGTLIPGSTIFSASEPLAAFIGWLADSAATHTHEQFELVINGDIVDLLCEAGDCTAEPSSAHAVSEAEAVRLCRLIFARYGQGDASPLGQLRRYLRGPGELTLLIGNHDVELSFPAVRRLMNEQLQVVAGRIRHVYDGEAYSVGDVLIEHGNRYDPWNVIDHDALRRDRSRMSRRKSTAGPLGERHFIPPAGSYIVAYVLNALKRRYRFVDLLKPENEAVIPLLLSLCPPSAPMLAEILAAAPAIGTRRIAAVGTAQGKPVNPGLLGADADADAAELSAAALAPPDRALFPEFGDISRSLRSNVQFSAWAESLDRLDRSARQLAQQIGTMASVAALLAPGGKDLARRRLLAALTALNRFDHFRLDVEVPPYSTAARRLVDEGGYAVVVFGHTHLPKFEQWQAAHGQATYINTGTWADVARLPPSILAGDVQALDTFARKLSSNELDDYVTRAQTYAEILVRDERAVQARLWRFCGPDHPHDTPPGSTAGSDVAPRIPVSEWR